MPSTVIREHHYERDVQELTITFVTARRYVYAGVPEQVYADFCAAPSKGAFFNKYIRDHFRCFEIPSE
jgi:hypothetical protein